MANFTGSAQAFDVYPQDLGQGGINYSANSVICLLGTGALPTVGLTRLNQIVGEISDTDYSRQTLTSLQWQQVGSQSKLISDPATFTAATASITAAWYALAYFVSTDANSPLLQFGWLDGTGQDNKVVNPPDSIIITPDGTNGWNDITVQ